MSFTINTGASVYAAIERIAATPSKNEKEELIKAAGSQSSLFMKVVTYAYDRRNFGIGMAPHKTAGIAPGGNCLKEPFVWACLDDLSTRTLTGNAARTKVQQIVDLLDEGSAEVFRRIINKDMRAGFTEGTINRVFKGTIEEPPYMRCTLPSKSNMASWDWSVGIFSQEKADGSFANVHHDGAGVVWITTRQGTQYPANALGLEEDIARFLELNTHTHGELLVYEAGELLPREKGNGVLNSLAQGGALEIDQKVVFMAWDQIPLDRAVSGGKVATPYRDRLRKLGGQALAAQRAGCVSVRLIPTRVVKSKAEAYAHYRELLKLGKEGTVVKHPDMDWKDSSSGNKDQVKLKLEVDVELRIKDFVPGTPGTKTAATFGSLLCQSECGELEVAVSGMTDAMRQKIHNDRERFRDAIITVKANSVMVPDDGADKHSLFLPRYVEIREDKRVADDLARIKAIFQNAVEAA